MSENKKIEKINIFKFAKRNKVHKRYSWWLEKKYNREDVRAESQWKKELEKHNVI